MKISGWGEAIREGDRFATEQLNFVGKSRGDAEDIVSEGVQCLSEASGLSGECGNMRLSLRG